MGCDALLTSNELSAKWLPVTILELFIMIHVYAICKDETFFFSYLDLPRYRYTFCNTLVSVPVACSSSAGIVQVPVLVLHHWTDTEAYTGTGTVQHCFADLAAIPANATAKIPLFFLRSFYCRSIFFSQPSLFYIDLFQPTQHYLLSLLV